MIPFPFFFPSLYSHSNLFPLAKNNFPSLKIILEKLKNKVFEIVPNPFADPFLNSHSNLSPSG